jgi:hypothetical protein
MKNYYRNKQDIKAVVAGFERCTTAKDEFTHLNHLTVATYYLRHSTPDQAFQKMRAGLLRFLDHQRVGRAKYNEPLTLAWIARVQEVIEQTNPDSSLVEVTNVVLERLGNMRIPVQEPAA